MTTKPLTQKLQGQQLQRGPHKSCQEHLKFIHQELLEFAQKGFWVVLPYKLMKDFKKLHLSPLGVVLQQNRRPCLIVDYTYYDINQETVILSPKEAMQFGRALECILYHIQHANPRYGPVYLGKIDLADGFYWVWVAEGDIVNLGVVLPKYAGEDQLVAFPLTLPMGWVESPPYFCTFTETMVDVANALLKNVDLPEHPLEHLANTKPSDNDMAASAILSRPGFVATPPRAQPVLRPYQHPLDHHNMYVDDFCSAVQGNHRHQVQHQR
jgi:hypothetical protein